MPRPKTAKQMESYLDGLYWGVNQQRNDAIDMIRKCDAFIAAYKKAVADLAEGVPLLQVQAEFLAEVNCYVE